MTPRLKAALHALADANAKLVAALDDDEEKPAPVPAPESKPQQAPEALRAQVRQTLRRHGLALKQ